LAVVAVEVDVAMAAAELIVNKRELAFRVLECSLPTVDALLERYPDFPVQRRGSNGIEWEFVAADAVAFLQKKRREDEAAGAQRSQLFEQFKLPIDELAGPDDAAITPNQRAALAQARLREHDLALKAGLVVPTAEARQQYQALLQRLGKFLDTLPQQLARQHALPEMVVQSMRRQLDEQRRAFVAEYAAELAGELALEQRDGTSG
jgi:phage terminase Nu1 subunit (DNA packaging protein)